MHRGIFGMSLVALMAAAVAASADATSSATSPAVAPAAAPVVVPAGNAKFQPVSGMTGVQYAVLWGDPTKAGGQYAARYKIADGVKFPVHTHPMSEQVTVLEGTFLVAVGSKWDASKLTPLPAGSYVEIPANLPHYAQAKGDVIVEIHGIGPDKMDLVKQD